MAYRQSVPSADTSFASSDGFEDEQRMRSKEKQLQQNGSDQRYAQGNGIESTASLRHSSSQDAVSDTAGAGAGASVEQMRWRQRKATARKAEAKREIHQLEESIQAAESRLQELEAAKVRHKEAILLWKMRFEEANQRKPTEADKEADARQLFLDYYTVRQ